MASLSQFIKQCLSEDKYGTQFVSEIEERIETLNLAQLQGMHSVLSKASAESKVKIWKDGNDEILKHVKKWLAIRTEEYEIQAAREAEVIRKVRARQKKKEIERREKENVMHQLKSNARKAAEAEIKEIEANRRAKYKAELFQVVEAAEAKRNYYLKWAFGVLIVGCIVCGVALPDTVMVASGIGIVVIVSGVLFYRAYKAQQVAPYDENLEGIERATNIREEELFLKALNTLKQNEQEYERRMAQDKEEKRRRLAAKREQEAINRIMAAADVEGGVGTLPTLNESEEVREDMPIDNRDANGPCAKGTTRSSRSRPSTPPESKLDESVAPGKLPAPPGPDDVQPFVLKERSKSKKEKLPPGNKASILEEVEDVRPPKGGNSNDAKTSNQKIKDTETSDVVSFEEQSSARYSLAVLSATLFDFMNNLECENHDVYLTMCIETSAVVGSDVARYRTQSDAQKCVGDTLIWRFDQSEAETMRVPNVGLSERCNVTFSLFDATNSELPFASGSLTGREILKFRKEIDRHVEVPCLQLYKNDVVKVCNVSLLLDVHSCNSFKSN